MKIKLAAATCLALSAAPVLAEIEIGGYGRFGAFHDDGTTDITSRLRLDVDGKAETDNGLKFSVRLRAQADDGGTAKFNGPRFSVSQGRFRAQIGNVDGAIDRLPGFYGVEPGLTNLTGQFTGLRAEYDESSNTGSGRNAVNMRYSANGLIIAGSYSDIAGIRRSAVHVAYQAKGMTAALGYQSSNKPSDDGLVVAALSKSFDRADVSLFFADEEAGRVFGMSGEVEVAASTRIQMSFSRNETDDYYGVGVTHDLGGGASLRGGIASVAGKTVADAGLWFNF